MTRYIVIITPAAEADAAQAFLYIYERSPNNAQRWIRQLYKAIDDLAEFRGYARAPESAWLETELRQKVFKSHRIIYSIDKPKRRVYVHYVRHAAQRAVGEPDVYEPE